MRLSILIPVYNYDCRRLVESLYKQLPEDCEIIVGDDGSADSGTKTSNRELYNLQRVVYWESPQNLGRAKIRNILVARAQGEYVLIIDADALVVSAKFLETYLELLPTKCVICGGILHPQAMPTKSVALRWKYEKFCAPHLTVERRTKNPYQSLSTFNILLPREQAIVHPFDESITLYGYEDTLFGCCLEADNIPIKHIDNPLLHIGLDSNEHFLAKTEEAMITLRSIRKRIGRHSTLLRYTERIHHWRLDGFVTWLFQLTSPFLRKNLLGENPNIILFQLYKIGYFIHLCKK